MIHVLRLKLWSPLMKIYSWIQWECSMWVVIIFHRHYNYVYYYNICIKIFTHTQKYFHINSFWRVVGVRFQAITQVKQLHAESVLRGWLPVRGHHVVTLTGRSFFRLVGTPDYVEWSTVSAHNELKKKERGFRLVHFQYHRKNLSSSSWCIIY